MKRVTVFLSIFLVMFNNVFCTLDTTIIDTKNDTNLTLSSEKISTDEINLIQDCYKRTPSPELEICRSVIDTGLDLSMQETWFNMDRYTNVVKPAYIKMFGRNYVEGMRLPKVGICGSGGGYRATIAYSALLEALEESGLLNITSHQSILSGSTWATIALFLRAQQHPGLSLLDFKNILKHRVVDMNFYKIAGKGIRKKLAAKDDIRKELSIKSKQRSVKPIDIWGALFANNLLGDIWDEDPHGFTFAKLRTFLECSTQYPFPIFTTTIKDFDPNDELMEVTPYFAGCNPLGGYVQTNLFGRRFENRKLAENFTDDELKVLEEDLATWMGLFGSAYSISPLDGIQFLQDTCSGIGRKLLGMRDKGFFSSILDKLHRFFDQTILSSRFNNFTYKISGLPKSDLKKLELTDGGVAYDLLNLPFAPLFRRGMDVVIICDASGDAPGGDFPQLEKAEDYARRAGYNFPSLKKYKKIGENVFVFESSDPDYPTPTFIYVEIREALSTLKFNYDSDEYEHLWNDIYLSMSNAETLKQIEGAIVRKTCMMNGVGANFGDLLF